MSSARGLLQSLANTAGGEFRPALRTLPRFEAWRFKFIWEPLFIHVATATYPSGLKLHTWLDQRVVLRSEIKGEPKAEDIRGAERHADLVVKERRRV